ncbi:hypothetical protein EYF80_040945 [Liparis tanakae]|uniref:Uncharacterized protein n=1 Tax=Liparis tanakae TaxID=230148 RepID=A0A4Z2G5R7_9TELE|nr:hypothetical protein EYF80_040945 [Liparis tanakae]
MDFSSGSFTSTSEVQVDTQDGFMNVQGGSNSTGIVEDVLVNNTQHDFRYGLYRVPLLVHYSFLSLTLGLQQTGDVELPLSEVKRLFQVLLVASRLDQ